MLIRYGLAHILSFIAALPVFFVAVRVSYIIAPDRAPRSLARRLLGKILLYLGILSLLLVPCLIFTVGTIVRVVDDGSGGALTWRSYLMFGSHATATTTGGTRLDIANQPGEIIVNASPGPIMLLPRHYGYGSEEIPPSQQLDPGQMAAYVNYPIFLGEPPGSVEAQSTTLSVKRVYIIRAN